MRLFSKEGRKDIKDDYNRATAITKAIQLVLTTNNAKTSKLFKYIGEYFKGYKVDKKIEFERNLSIIDNPDTSVLEKQEAAKNITNIMGLNVKFANLESYSGGKFNSDDLNSLYINAQSIKIHQSFYWL
ncbi:hypothetical protein [Campylobacter gastrosuis]|uniref:Uncharacterized protein n=1 Tax=Campylobacter gastrosuis TaxID=2974576 RepID=A0ABT7HR40_9BACT|nr:hypothetical protein [Campylobacter gastrosuis]MDL0089304.1 hypothetical protein [Campylobacter gastrosuis]